MPTPFQLSTPGKKMIRVAMWAACFLMLTGAVPSVGCSSNPDEFTRYDISGVVTFDGKPISHGSIVFEPDTTAGNRGPQGFATIEDGKFNTADSGKGQVGGPHIVRIEGMSSPVVDELATPERLFPSYQESLDLPQEVGTITMDVPADAGR